MNSFFLRVVKSPHGPLRNDNLGTRDLIKRTKAPVSDDPITKISTRESGWVPCNTLQALLTRLLGRGVCCSNLMEVSQEPTCMSISVECLRTSAIIDLHWR